MKKDLSSDSIMEILIADWVIYFLSLRMDVRSLNSKFFLDISHPFGMTDVKLFKETSFKKNLHIGYAESHLVH